MLCKKCGVEEMDCDCPQWSTEAQAILRARALLESLPVPTKGRIIYDPVSGEFIGPIDLN